MIDEDKLAFLDQPRDDQGRFASKTQEPPAQVEEPAPPAQEQPAEPVAETPAVQSAEPPAAKATPPEGYIPINAVLDEREKRQALQRELEEFKRKFAEREKQPPAPPPDPIADPEGFQRALDERLAQTQWDATTRISLRFALQSHGAEAVKAAEDWVAEQAQSNPAFIQTIRQQVDPYDFVVKQHKIALRNAKLGDETDLDAAFEKWAAERGYQKLSEQQPVQSSAAAPSPQSTPLPKPSLATARSAGGTAPRVPMGPGAAFEGVFKS